MLRITAIHGLCNWPPTFLNKVYLTMLCPECFYFTILRPNTSSCFNQNVIFVRVKQVSETAFQSKPLHWLITAVATHYIWISIEGWYLALMYSFIHPKGAIEMAPCAFTNGLLKSQTEPDGWNISAISVCGVERTSFPAGVPVIRGENCSKAIQTLKKMCK